MYIANLGDSRAMVMTHDEKLFKVSQDHKPWSAVEKKRIYKAGHFVNPFKIYYSKSKKCYDNGDILVDTNLRKHFIYLEGNWEIITADQFKQILSMNEDYDTHRVCNSLALSRAFGDFYLKMDKDKKYMGLKAAISPEPDVDVIDLKPHRNKVLYILIGSDGFWDVNYVTKGLKQQVKAHPDGKQLCEKLVLDSLKKGSQDNTTVIFDKFKL
jgi:serine/threonine protein phosphatase PrpC